MAFGEVPPYVRGAAARRWIERNLQLRLPLENPANLVKFPGPAIYRDASGRKVPAHVWNQQPRKFPPGYLRMADGNPNWRADYCAEWVEKRKAAGLPHLIHERKFA